MSRAGFVAREAQSPSAEKDASQGHGVPFTGAVSFGADRPPGSSTLSLPGSLTITGSCQGREAAGSGAAWGRPGGANTCGFLSVLVGSAHWACFQGCVNPFGGAPGRDSGCSEGRRVSNNQCWGCFCLPFTLPWVTF